MHQLEPFPVPFRQLEIRITFSLKVRHLVTIICALNKTINCLVRHAVSEVYEVRNQDILVVEGGSDQGS